MGSVKQKPVERHDQAMVCRVVVRIEWEENGWNNCHMKDQVDGVLVVCF